MFDLGRTFLAAVERSPEVTAVVDGKRRLGYGSWYSAWRLGRERNLAVIDAKAAQGGA